MSFEVAAESYDRFMGRYSRHLSGQLADLVAVAPPQRALDVGCGPGALTAELVRRLGASSVTAVDPSESFVAAIRERFPGVTVERAPAEELPFGDDSFDAAIAQLVVHFMADPVAGLREMARVTRPGGALAACVWDHGPNGRGPLTTFFAAAHEIDPAFEAVSNRPGSCEGQLGELFREAGIADVSETVLEVAVEHPIFAEWWEPFTLGVGPTADWYVGLGPERQAALEKRCRELLPPEPFTVHARAWTAYGAAA